MTIALDALRRRITIEEAALRDASVEQMVGRVGRLLARDRDLPRWTVRAGDQVRPDRAALTAEVGRLCGEGVGDLTDLRLHASFVAIMFYEDCAVGSWWATPLGQLCDRALNGED